MAKIQSTVKNEVGIGNVATDIDKVVTGRDQELVAYHFGIPLQLSKRCNSISYVRIINGQEVDIDDIEKYAGSVMIQVLDRVGQLVFKEISIEALSLMCKDNIYIEYEDDPLDKYGDNKKKITRLWSEKRTVEEWEISKYEEKALENRGDGSQDAFDNFCKQLFSGQIQV